MPIGEFAIRLITALVLGTLIGLERQWHRRLDDLKVTALVCMGAALFSGAHEYFPWRGEDPTRVAAQVVVGVGFLGAGLLWRDRGEVRGITTAATVWCSAAVGMLTGTGALAESVVATVIIVAGNTLLRPVGRLMHYRMATDSFSLQRHVRVRFPGRMADDVHRTLHAFADHRAVGVRRSLDTPLDGGQEGVVELFVELDGEEGERAFRSLGQQLRDMGVTQFEAERVG